MHNEILLFQSERAIKICLLRMKNSILFSVIFFFLLFVCSLFIFAVVRFDSTVVVPIVGHCHFRPAGGDKIGLVHGPPGPGARVAVTFCARHIAFWSKLYTRQEKVMTQYIPNSFTLILFLNDIV